MELDVVWVGYSPISISGEIGNTVKSKLYGLEDVLVVSTQ